MNQAEYIEHRVEELNIEQCERQLTEAEKIEYGELLLQSHALIERDNKQSQAIEKAYRTGKVTGFQPIPTEYKGTVFRSKCEALFARALHELDFIYCYEPNHIHAELDLEWMPDFQTMCQETKGIREIIIEYKPSGVTETYLSEKTVYFNKLIDNDPERICLLLCINPYEDKSNSHGYIFQVHGNNQISDGLTESFYNAMVAAKSYRFDLS